VTGEYWCVVDLGPVRVAVALDHDGLIDYLRDFYPLEVHAERDGAVDWVIETRMGEPVPGMALTP
jgi:hypothetical protein